MNLKFLPVTESQEYELQHVFEKAPEYFRRVEGTEVLPHFAKKELETRPQNLSPTYQKIYFFIELDGENVGAIDFHKDHPRATQGYIGLFLLDESHQKQGLGRKTYLAFENYIRENYDVRHLLLGVSERNDFVGFWKKMGYQLNGKTYVWQGERIETLVYEMEKLL